LSTTLTLLPAPLDTWTLTLTLADVDGERLARRQAWLGV